MGQVSTGTHAGARALLRVFRAARPGRAAAAGAERSRTAVSLRVMLTDPSSGASSSSSPGLTVNEAGGITSPRPSQPISRRRNGARAMFKCVESTNAPKSEKAKSHKQNLAKIRGRGGYFNHQKRFRWLNYGHSNPKQRILRTGISPGLEGTSSCS